MLKQHPHFPDKPGFSRELKTLRINLGVAHYAARVFGYLVPPETASFKFQLTGNSAAEMFLSESEVTTTVKQIAQSSSGNPSVSKPVRLEKGKRYFFDVLFKQSVRLRTASADERLQRWCAYSFAATLGT